ncbi:hypothetical protein LZ30DRAFT_443176 [Colletotrichum cereale]|nr:hypothetical protein LZ30DRAFT_443176 [Colletotrichum cereale]
MSLLAAVCQTELPIAPYFSSLLPFYVSPVVILPSLSTLYFNLILLYRLTKILSLLSFTTLLLRNYLMLLCSSYTRHPFLYIYLVLVTLKF